MLRREVMCSRWLAGARAAGPVALSLFLALTAPATGAEAANSQAPASGGVRAAAATAIRRTRLDNGLRIVLSRDSAAPTVAICLAIARSPSIDAPDERMHVLEHLLLRDDPNARALHRVESIMAKAPSIAVTETTHFVTLWPAHALALGLARQAERLKGMPIADSDIETELRLIASESRGGGPLEPSDSGTSALRQRLLGREVGPSADRRAVDAGGLQELQRLYFTPGRAVLSVSGDFEVLEALRLIREHLGAIAPGTAVAARPAPPPASARLNGATALEDPNILGPLLLLGWELPTQRNTERTALDLVAQVLGGGETSRLLQMLVHEQGSARSVEVWTENRDGRDLLAIRAVLQDGANPSHVRRSIQAQLSALARFGPTARELAKAKGRARVAHLLSLEGNLRRSMRLAEAELVWSDAGLINGELDAYENVSGIQVARAVARHLTFGHLKEVLVNPRATSAGGREARDRDAGAALERYSAELLGSPRGSP